MAEKALRKLETTKQITGLTNRFYDLVNTAHDRGEKIAWVIGPFPYEPLRAMNIRFVHQENYAARLASRKVAPYFQKMSVDWGLSKDACSYLRADHGMCLVYSRNFPLPKEAKDYQLAKPDMVLFLNYCVSAAKTAEMYHHHLGVPIYGLDYFYHGREIPESESMPYVTKNLEGLISFLEDQTGKKMDYDHFSEVIKYAKQTAEIRNEVLDMARTIPSPMTGFDGMISLGASNLWRGAPEAVAYLKDVKTEVEQRVKNKISAVANEKLRLLWDLVAIWSHIGYFAEFLAQHDAVVVVDTYSRVFNFDPDLLDARKPLESIARSIVNFMPDRRYDWKLNWYKQACKDFSVDGILSHSPRTCRRACVPTYLYWELLEREAGIPTCRFDADHSDPDFYSKAQVETRVEAFIEMLHTRKFGHN